MEKYSTIRRATQLTSLGVSSIIFAIGLYGILTHNDLYFEIGLLLIGFIITGGLSEEKIRNDIIIKTAHF